MALASLCFGGGVLLALVRFLVLTSHNAMMMIYTWEVLHGCQTKGCQIGTSAYKAHDDQTFLGISSACSAIHS